MDAVQQITVQSIDESQIVSTITETLKKLKEAKNKRKSVKEQLDEKLKHNPVYASFKEDEAEAKDGAKTEKAKIYQSSEAMQLLEMDDEAKQQIKELNEQLAAELEIYHEKTKKLELEILGKKVRLTRRVTISPGQQSLF